jgi:prolyl oligopeptidase
MTCDPAEVAAAQRHQGEIAADDPDTMFVSRLEAFPAQCEQYVALLQHGVASGMVASKDMLRSVGPQILEQATDGCEVVQGLSTRAARFDAAAGGGERGAAAVRGFQAACVRVEQYVREEYAPHARAQSGCTGFGAERGQQIYALCLRFHTTTSMSPQEVHDVGLAEVARIQARYASEVLEPLGLPADGFKAFVEACRSGAQHYYSNKGELLDGYRVLTAEIENLLPVRAAVCLPACLLAPPPPHHARPHTAI